MENRSSHRVVVAGPPPLPIWLTISQVLGWVLFRSIESVAHSIDGDGLAAQMMYGTQELVGEKRQLEEALQSGRLIAHGTKKNEGFSPIPAIEWSRLPIAPLDATRQYPYIEIRASQSEVVKLFPPNESAPADHRHASTAQPSKRSGRPKGSGSMAAADEPLLQEMRQLIAAREAFSANGAAIAVASKAKGAGTQDSRAARLAKRYLASEKN